MPQRSRSPTRLSEGQEVKDEIYDDVEMNGSTGDHGEINDSEENHDDNIPADDMERSDRIAKLEPPPSCGENFRDMLLRLLDSQFFQFMGLLVLVLVIADGAFFFFLLMGWQNMCRPRTDCDPRNDWYNFAVQALNILFTYMATVSMPWRCTNAIHIAGCGCPYRSNKSGRDLYGIPTKDIWFYIPLRSRGGIIIILLLNCLTQYANQATRIIYYNFDLQNTSPGNIWTNVFFASSMACAALGGAWLIYEETLLRRSNPPGTFPPGLFELLRSSSGCLRSANVAEQVAEGQEEEEDPGPLVEFNRYKELPQDPTRNRSLRNITDASRPSMRLFGM
jgi:hypothetical protein